MTLSITRPAITSAEMAVLVVGRFLLSSAYRVVYPLLAFLAAGLATDLRSVSWLITIQLVAQLLSPLGGSLADTRGERTTMLTGMAAFCVGALVCAMATSLPVFLVGYGAIGIGNAFFQPAAIAYASARSSYQRRALVLGVLEFSWALSALVGVTTLSRIVEANQTWGLAYGVLLAGGLLTTVATLFILSPHVPRTVAPGEQHTAVSARLFLQRNVIAFLVFIFCCMLGYELVIVAFSPWLAAAFQAELSLLGLVFGSLGFVELGGAALSASFADRLGKKRAVVMGFLCVAAGYALLPFTAGTWAALLPVFWLIGLSVEFAIVSNVALTSTIVPAARGTMIALMVATFALARAVGSLLSVPLYETYGYTANGLLASGFVVLGVLCCVLFVREGET